MCPRAGPSLAPDWRAPYRVRMTDHTLPTGPDDDVPPAEIGALLRRVPPDGEAQLAALALLQAYRREALGLIATCLDAAEAGRAVARARARLKRRLLTLLGGAAGADEGPPT